MPTRFGKWLRETRLHSSLSMAEVERRTGINYTHISRMENGRSRPSRDTVLRLADALNADIDAALIAAYFIPFDAAHLSDPDTERLAADYHHLPPPLKEFVRQAVETAKRMAAEQPLSRLDEHRLLDRSDNRATAQQQPWTNHSIGVHTEANTEAAANRKGQPL